jgi:putative acyl-CoA dehydrogenase
LTLQAALLVRHCPGPVADAFVASRLGGDHGGTFGTLGTSLGPDAVSLILERALPA